MSGAVSMTPANLTIGAAAAEAGVSVAVLRSWEERHSFPIPERMPSGHRRYSARQVQQIQQVQRDRRAGMSLDAAIARAVAGDDRAEASIFEGLRARWPDLPVHVLSTRAMTAISRAIEDECAHAERPVLVGMFQRERHYRRSEARWRELARTATSAVVFADFATTSRRRGRPTEIPVPGDARLLREWAVVCDAANVAACVAGVERPGRGRGGSRRFETVWSVDPIVVRYASDIAARLAASASTRGHGQPTTTTPPTTDPAGVLRAGTAILNRVVAYLDP